MPKTTGRRFGNVANRVIVAVSDALVQQRKTQYHLNTFVWSTELCYGIFLNSYQADELNFSKPVVELFQDVPLEAWYLNNQGYIKFPLTLERQIQQVKSNMVNICDAIIVYFYSAFELYLDSRVEHLRPSLLRSWGPLVQSLSHEELLQGVEALQFETVVKADICRLIRNLIVHESGIDLPLNLRDPKIEEWKVSLCKKAIQAKWGNIHDEKTIKKKINDSFGQVIGQAANEIKQARDSGKELPIQFFYMLFTFTNFDNLAFEIEEALIEKNRLPNGRIQKREELVRRKDLIVGEVER
jgi:hypothetical protein